MKKRALLLLVPGVLAVVISSSEVGRWSLWQIAFSLGLTSRAVTLGVRPAPLRTRTVEDQQEAADRPFVLRGFLLGSRAMRWGNVSWLTASPRGDIPVDYFSNGSVGLVPDARARLRDVPISSGAKLGTERLFRSFPDLLDDLPLDKLAASFGYFRKDRIGSTLTVPLFWGRGDAKTALHSEPVANLALQLAGHRTWTLVDPALSHTLAPSATVVQRVSKKRYIIMSCALSCVYMEDETADDDESPLEKKKTNIEELPRLLDHHEKKALPKKRSMSVESIALDIPRTSDAETLETSSRGSSWNPPPPKRPRFWCCGKVTDAFANEPQTPRTPRRTPKSVDRPSRSLASRVVESFEINFTTPKTKETANSTKTSKRHTFDPNLVIPQRNEYDDDDDDDDDDQPYVPRPSVVQFEDDLNDAARHNNDHE
ncbi:hypothetical protein CTAYLR_003163 [Chrysophaeum taylorii]|uniref:Cupin-like domain-containing protein n=1 Tax=Chrysophaeum taylorii TaxID=2483200 RepID=A0AAD7XRT2_9STRA|nr:hypothetical protein CTAYLR_003163 [Chrysophaeum taylorii]